MRQSVDMPARPQITPPSTMDILCQNLEVPNPEGQQRTYEIITQHSDFGDFSIYVVRYEGTYLEAQVFTQCRLPLKMYLSRKRRVQRLRRSVNFFDEFEKDGVRFFVSRIPEDGIEKHQKAQRVEMAVELNHDLSTENYPPLCSSNRNLTGNRMESICYGTTHPSFAAVASSSPKRKDIGNI
ncbi:hypothetical protein F4805DRAFT_441846 [Annulohypoxylon moriforme]|nr:hypothetical protein F4805DRAFT_441846 [Annulohypoxylon moriforme]